MQPAVRSGTTKPGASEDLDKDEKKGVRCECSGVEEHRTAGGADGDEAEGARCPVILMIQRWSHPSCDKVLTGGRNRTGQESRAAGGGAPGWRPRPFGLVGAGSGVGVGRRGENIRDTRIYQQSASLTGLRRITPPIPTVLPVPGNQVREDSYHALSWSGGPPPDPAVRGAHAHE